MEQLALYQRMAQIWVQKHAQAGAQTGGGCGASADESIPGQDPLKHRVRELIAHMPMIQRMTLSLVDVARLSYRETAAVMGIGLFDVQYHVVTARRQLLEELHSGACNLLLSRQQRDHQELLGCISPARRQQRTAQIMPDTEDSARQGRHWRKKLYRQRHSKSRVLHPHFDRQRPADAPVVAQ